MPPCTSTHGILMGSRGLEAELLTLRVYMTVKNENPDIRAATGINLLFTV